jgi:hypothetical protein
LSARTHRTLAALLLPLALTVTAVGSSTTGAARAAPAGPAAVVRSGVYEGPCNTKGVAAFEQWRGKRAALTSDGLDGTRWDYLESPKWWTDCWAARGSWLVLSVPMLMNDDSLRAGARGAYDDHFRRLAEALVAGGQADAGLRLGWEFNGTWYHWSAVRDPSAFKAYFRRVATVMRSVPGTAFTVIWNPVFGEQAMDAEQAWPGDDVVDVVGIDVYDASWEPRTYPYAHDGSARQSEARAQAQEVSWQLTENADHGLDFWASFAAAHHKPLGVPEWGLVSRADGHGGGDDPAFVEHMRDWIDTHNVEFEMYFDTPGALGEHRLRSGEFPQAAARYRELFGG